MNIIQVYFDSHFERTITPFSGHSQNAVSYFNTPRISNIIRNNKERLLETFDYEEYCEEEIELVRILCDYYAVAEFVRNWLTGEYGENEEQTDEIFKQEMMCIGWVCQCYGQDALSQLPISIEDHYAHCLYFRK